MGAPSHVRSEIECVTWPRADRAANKALDDTFHRWLNGWIEREWPFKAARVIACVPGSSRRGRFDRQPPAASEGA